MSIVTIGEVIDRAASRRARTDRGGCEKRSRRAALNRRRGDSAPRCARPIAMYAKCAHRGSAREDAPEAGRRDSRSARGSRPRLPCDGHRRTVSRSSRARHGGVSAAAMAGCGARRDHAPDHLFRHAAARVRSASALAGASRDPGGVCEHPCCIPWPGRLLLEMALLIPVVGDRGFATTQLSVSLRKEQLDDDFRSCSLDTKDW